MRKDERHSPKPGPIKRRPVRRACGTATLKFTKLRAVAKKEGPGFDRIAKRFEAVPSRRIALRRPSLGVYWTHRRGSPSAASY